MSAHLESVHEMHESDVPSGEPESVQIVPSFRTMNFGSGEFEAPDLAPVEKEVPGGISDSGFPYREESFVKIQRFVVKINMDGHYICLPILTYGGQGTLKKGVHAEDHMVVFTGKAPILLPGEVLPGPALRMEAISRHDKLDPTSRINVAKVYTVEHNVEVCFIGKLTIEAMKELARAYNKAHPPLLEDSHIGAPTWLKEEIQGSMPEFVPG